MDSQAPGRPDVSPRRPSTIKVESHAGHRAEEHPLRFFLGERKIEVVEIIDRWLDPDHSYFKIRGDDGGIYILRFEVATNTWEMTLFNSGNRDDTRLSST